MKEFESAGLKLKTTLKVKKLQRRKKNKKTKKGSEENKHNALTTFVL